MNEPSPEDRLAQTLLGAVESLRSGRAAAAVPALTEVCADPSLAAAADLVDVRARAHSLLAQALLESGQPADARRPLSVAERLAIELGDREALQTLAELRGQIGAAETANAERAHRARQSARLAEMSLAETSKLGCPRPRPGSTY